MSLKDWLDNGWLKSHQTDPQEIANLFAIVERDLADASLNDLSVDWQFGIAYNASLKLCNIMLYVHGYRPENALAHYRAIMALKEIEEENWEQYSVYLHNGESPHKQGTDDEDHANQRAGGDGLVEKQDAHQGAYNGLDGDDDGGCRGFQQFQRGGVGVVGQDGRYGHQPSKAEPC